MTLHEHIASAYLISRRESETTDSIALVIGLNHWW